jgi:ribosome maturation factor RimP
MEQIENKLRELIQPIFDEKQIYLVDVRIRGNRGNQIVTVLADTISGITLEQITALTREINFILDQHEDLIDSRYRLEVSSPGVNRELEFLWEYQKNLGRELSIHYRDGDEIVNFSGKLIEVKDNNVTISHKKEQRTIALEKIVKAKVRLKW